MTGVIVHQFLSVLMVRAIAIQTDVRDPVTGVIVHQLLSVLMVTAIAIQREVRHLVTGVGSCCTSTSQCANGQGDCNSDGGKGLNDWIYCKSTSQ